MNSVFHLEASRCKNTAGGMMGRGSQLIQRFFSHRKLDVIVFLFQAELYVYLCLSQRSGCNIDFRTMTISCNAIFQRHPAVVLSSMETVRCNILSSTEDIPSDAEAEARLQCSERGEPLPDEAGASESLERVSSLGTPGLRSPPPSPPCPKPSGGTLGIPTVPIVRPKMCPFVRFFDS